MSEWKAPKDQAQQIHDYWFGSADDWQQVLKDNGQRWFGSGEAMDSEIRSGFATTLDSAQRGEMDEWQDSIIGIMALVLLLDQFPRHIHRGNAQAFAYDSLSLKACLRGIERGIDSAMSPVQHVFFYLPLQHAEDLQVQTRSIEMMELRTGQCSEDFKAFMANSLDYARQHHAIIQRFGRFPHRNQILDRANTEEEQKFLDAGADRFGQ
jgi:uncharacterized protein (DUF924 family)